MILCSFFYIKRLFFIPLLLILPYTLNAQEVSNMFAFKRFNLHFENDIFDKTDKNYTNGVKFSALYKIDAQKYDYFQIPFLYEASKNHFVTFSFGQDIYTPSETNITIPDSNDHPYAAWLYVGCALHQADDKESETLELQLGVVGPWALGEQVQNGIHSVTGSEKALGWDSQLHNELGVVLAYEHRWRHATKPFLWGVNADVLPFVGGTLGNIYTYANVGAVARIGWNIPQDFAKAIEHPAQVAGLPALKKDDTMYREKWAFYFLSSFDMHALARYIFLDGNTFGDSPSVQRDYFVGEYTAGIGIDYGAFHIAFMNTFSSEDYALDVRGFSFGTISFSYLY